MENLRKVKRGNKTLDLLTPINRKDKNGNDSSFALEECTLNNLYEQEKSEQQTPINKFKIE